VQVGEKLSVSDCTERFVSLTNRLDEVYECVAIYWFAEEANRTPFQVESLGVLWGFSLDDHDWNWTIDAPYVMEQPESAHGRHFNVCNNRNSWTSRLH
jgi:hypothetical protein